MIEDILANENENKYLFVYTFLLVVVVVVVVVGVRGNPLDEYHVIWQHTYIPNINANGVSFNPTKSGDNMKKYNSLFYF